MLGCKPTYDGSPGPACGEGLPQSNPRLRTQRNACRVSYQSNRWTLASPNPAHGLDGQAQAVLDAARHSMGMDISEVDLLNVTT